MQPYACILVRAKKDREMLAEAMLGTNGKKVTDAPVVAVFAADLEPSLRIPHVQKMMHEDGAPLDMVNQLPLMVRMFAGEGHLGGLIRSCISTVVSPLKATPAFVPTIAWAYKQASLAASSFLFAAHSHGLGTCPMEGFDETRVKNCLDIPDRYSVPIIIACGYPQEDKLPTKQTPRLPATDLFFDGKFGNSSAKLFD
jgi:nitroreductase